ncbi:hypothetical protein Heshes_03200 [Alicyclobacillus hesperidum]|uniref:Uncharacterized protein n=1 Tax=Alicyclobacillus hesperidum TaxID=89784 RepID=A0A1H2XUS1_9BACL|nr:hypothetical protein [Alicyclobacillus hesperidum]GLV12636.1 hypothetical protein Heshes_03200 [Alicyclobacillus hesperidum]SDW96348.1 hypothetical protein SAMN04489725_12425 [Alicyclobacillus hesperidum]
MANKRSDRPFMQWFDDLLIPVTMGVLSVLVLVQVVGMAPSMRKAMDRMEGRFVSATVAEPASVRSASGSIVLTASSVADASHVVVFRNGVSLGTFTTNQMDILVHEGDHITFRDETPNGPEVFIYVTDQAPNLLLPATGETVELGSGTATADLDQVSFM